MLVSRYSCLYVCRILIFPITLLVVKIKKDLISIFPITLSWQLLQLEPLENIKIHGHWKSDAIWSYLSDTPKAASVVASAFQQHIT